MENRIKNFEELATTDLRRVALTIAEAGLESLDTEKVVQSSVHLEGDTLDILGEKFDLSKFKSIKVVGFGKASCVAAAALEKVLGSKIREGAVIGLETTACEYIETFAGTHPKPSQTNIKAGEKIYHILKNSEADDLVIVIVSGGGSALLCSSENEREEGIRLYDAFLRTGKTRIDMNTVWKHLSILKGGGLAKIAYPATIIGLIFSDLPGNHFENVASGPTYKDETTIEDALKVIRENNLGDFNPIETPKENKYFEKVHNFVLVSNNAAVEAMGRRAAELGFKAKIISTELYGTMDEIIDQIFIADESGTAVLAAGEPKLIVGKHSGRGGRNQHLGLLALCRGKIAPESIFLSLASDGLDNSDAAGAIVDHKVKELADKLGLDGEAHLKNFDSYTFLKATGGMIVTGPTGANVSDLFMLLSAKNS